MKSSKELLLLGVITNYLAMEAFPVKHLEAIRKIISTFNWSEESEKEVFEFAEKINAKYRFPSTPRQLCIECEEELVPYPLTEKGLMCCKCGKYYPLMEEKPSESPTEGRMLGVNWINSKKEKLHPHPAMERMLGVPDSYCIVDRLALLNLLTDVFPKGGYSSRGQGAYTITFKVASGDNCEITFFDVPSRAMAIARFKSRFGSNSTVLNVKQL